MTITKIKQTLIFLDYFTPAYKAGGPIRIFEAVARDCLENSVSIVTQDQDWGDPQILPGVASNSWTAFERARVFYASREKRSYRAIRQLIESVQPASIHLNSFFSPTWTVKILLLKWLGFFSGIELFISPHGEMANSALQIKEFKKRFFMSIGTALGLYRGLSWIATSQKEVSEIRAHFPDAKSILFLPPPLPQIYPHRPASKQPGFIRMVFFARLSAMKNIGFLLQILPHVKGRIDFDIFGPLDSDFANEWQEIFGAFQKLGPSCRITYHGPMPSAESAATLADYELFIQPSLSENFGYSIVEALAAGTPVLISDRTPWNCVNSENIGAALDLDRPANWIEFLNLFSDFDQNEWSTWSIRAQNWVSSKSSTTECLLEIYQQSHSKH